MMHIKLTPYIAFLTAYIAVFFALNWLNHTMISYKYLFVGVIFTIASYVLANILFKKNLPKSKH